MADATGYKLRAPSGDDLGKVVGHLPDGFVVSLGGLFGRAYRVVPHEHVWLQEERRTVLLVVPRDRLVQSPPCDRRGDVDPELLQRYWSTADG